MIVFNIYILKANPIKVECKCNENSIFVTDRLLCPIMHSQIKEK